ncbi:amidase signature enzyme, partial [Schizopora paradoxa]
LSGRSVAVKDTICTKDMKTTCSSAMLKEFQSPFDATVVSILRQQDAMLIGKTNCDEFGMGSHNLHSVHGPVVNPHVPPLTSVASGKRSAGGSSGGSAAAVAAGLCYAALSTDTGGSTRLPAAYCGVAGFKPSYGLISRWGVVSFADSLDCVGILARHSSEVKNVFGKHATAHPLQPDVLNLYDPKDPTSAPTEVRNAAKQDSMSFRDAVRNRQRLDGVRIGIPEEYFPKELEPSSLTTFKGLVQRLRTSGAQVSRVSLPNTRYALSAYYVIASAEASSNLARYTGVHYGTRVPASHSVDKKKTSNVYSHTRSRGFGHEVQKRILLGTYALSADAFDNYFLQAQQIRKLVRDDFERVLRHPSALSSPSKDATLRRSGVDFILYPTAIGSAPSLDEAKNMSELEVYLQDVLTVPTSLAGLPTLSVPIGLGDDGWPLGASLTGQWGHDESVLELGDIVERVSRESAL